MNHLAAIDKGLSERRAHNEIARKVFLVYPTHAFVGAEEVEFEILDEVADFFQIPIYAIQAAGSGKIGYSLHKDREFISGTSDLDLAIIDAQLFSYYLELGLKLSKNYSDGSVFSTSNKSSTQPEYLQYLVRGILRPDLMPNGTEKAKWANFFGTLSGKHRKFFKSISGAVYMTQKCFESKQRSVVAKRAAMKAI